MKMTRLEWTYLQRIALDHPYFDTHKLPLTEKEAKAIVEANNTMTGREFVDSIYAKLGMTRPKEEKKRFAWLRGIGELFAVPPIRKIAIAMLVVILMAIFFAATPTGRAIAESVIQYIVKMFDGKGVVVYQTDVDSDTYKMVNGGLMNDDIQYQDIKTPLMPLGSFEEFTYATGKQPYILPLQTTSLSYIVDDEEITLLSLFNTPKGHIVVHQTWGSDELVTISSRGYEVLAENDNTYCSVEEKYNSISCVRVFEDSVLIIDAKGSFDLKDLLSLLN